MMSALLASLRTRPAIWLLVGTGLLVLVLANAHLVYVAMTSQPDCVVHLRAGERAADPGQFRAAKSSCSPR
jgi:hypothetical protein